MEQEKALLESINRKLDNLMDLRDAIQDHIDMDRIMFYGEDGKTGLVGDVNELKQSRRFYNKVLATLGVAVATVFGEGIWRIFR